MLECAAVATILRIELSMTEASRPRVIAIEEHYWDADIAAQFDAAESRPGKMRDRLFDLGELRIREMDEAGVDFRSSRRAHPARIGSTR